MILFVVDSREGMLPLDQDVAQRLRGVKCPIILLANKTDNESLDPQADEFYRLGRGKPLRISTIQNRNRAVLLNMIVAHLPPPLDDDPLEIGEPEMKVAIVGRRNVGKSTFVNTLAQAERMIVSEIPGTTRDSVDVRFELDGKSFVAIDTPGIRRTKSVKTDIDFYGTHRAQRSIRRADVVLLFFDATRADQQGRQAALRLHRRAVQAVHLRRQQVGPARQVDAHGEVGPLPARHVSARCATRRSRSSPARPART